MRRADAFPSKYYKATELPGPITLTIASVTQEMIGQGDDQALKTVVTFREGDKTMVLNATNWGILEAAFGEDSDDWAGQRIVLRSEDTMFKGKPCKGLRVKPAPARAAAKPAPKPAVANDVDLEDDALWNEEEPAA